MSAPSTAYFPINFKFRGSNNIEMTVNPAKAQADLATLKARFYLDDVICFQANVGGVLYHGFWGVVLPSGFNYNHHKTTRLLEINGPKPGQLLRTFNDAGLNTLGDVTAINLVGFTIGNISFNASYLSAFYLTTLDHILEYRLDSSSWNTTQYGSLAAQTSITRTRTLSALLSVSAGQTISIRASISNAEGTYTTDIITQTILAKQVTARYSSAWPSQASGSNTIWLKTNFNYDTFYNSSDVINPVIDGFYVFEGSWFRINGGVLTTQGADSPGSYPSGDPGNPTIQTFNWAGYSTASKEDARAAIGSSSFGTMYRSPSDNKWYFNYNSGTNSFTNLVTTGYYSRIDEFVIYIINGVQQILIQ